MANQDEKLKKNFTFEKNISLFIESQVSKEEKEVKCQLKKNVMH